MGWCGFSQPRTTPGGRSLPFHGSLAGRPPRKPGKPIGARGLGRLRWLDDESPAPASEHIVATTNHELALLNKGPKTLGDQDTSRPSSVSRLRYRMTGRLDVDLVAHPTFDVAHNLLLYTWFERSFVRPAELQAFACLEMGLRYHLDGLDYVLKGRSSLRKLLRRAVEKGSLHDQCIRPYPRLTGFGRAWSREHGAQLPEPGIEDTDLPPKVVPPRVLVQAPPFGWGVVQEAEVG